MQRNDAKNGGNMQGMRGGQRMPPSTEEQLEHCH
jgi:hypothetical protein